MLSSLVWCFVYGVFVTTWYNHLCLPVRSTRDWYNALVADVEGCIYSKGVLGAVNCSLSHVLWRVSWLAWYCKSINSQYCMLLLCGSPDQIPGQMAWNLQRSNPTQMLSNVSLQGRFQNWHWVELMLLIICRAFRRCCSAQHFGNTPKC